MPDWLIHLLTAGGGIGVWKFLEFAIDRWLKKPDAVPQVVIQQQGPAPDPNMPLYKENFLEKQGDFLHELTSLFKDLRKEIQDSNAELAGIARVVLAVDERNFPKVWEDRELAQDTNEKVEIIGKATGELIKLVGDKKEKAA